MGENVIHLAVIPALIDFRPTQFQNRRNRTKREVKLLRKKPMYEGAAQPLDGLYKRMKGHMVDPVSRAPKSSPTEGTIEVGPSFASQNYCPHPW